MKDTLLIIILIGICLLGGCLNILICTGHTPFFKTRFFLGLWKFNTPETFKYKGRTFTIENNYIKNDGTICIYEILINGTIVATLYELSHDVTKSREVVFNSDYNENEIVKIISKGKKAYRENLNKRIDEKSDNKKSFFK